MLLNSVFAHAAVRRRYSVSRECRRDDSSSEQWPIGVLWFPIGAPSNVSISGVLSENTVDVGSFLTCIATGYPAPIYHWTDRTSGLVTNGSTLRVTRLGHQTFSCMASNVIRGTRRSMEQTISVVVTGRRFLHAGRSRCFVNCF